MKLLITSLLKGQRGSAIIIVAVAMVSFLLIAALVVDVGSLLYHRVHLQNAADAAALAAAGYWVGYGEGSSYADFAEEYEDVYRARYEYNFNIIYLERRLLYISQGMTEEEAEQRAKEEAEQEAGEIAHAEALEAAGKKAGDKIAGLRDQALLYIGLHGLDGDVLEVFTAEPGSSPLNLSRPDQGQWADGGLVYLLLEQNEELFFSSLVNLDFWTFTMDAEAQWQWTWDYPDPGDKSTVEVEVHIYLNK